MTLLRSSANLPLHVPSTEREGDREMTKWIQLYSTSYSLIFRAITSADREVKIPTEINNASGADPRIL